MLLNGNLAPRRQEREFTDYLYTVTLTSPDTGVWPGFLLVGVPFVFDLEVKLYAAI